MMKFGEALELLKNGVRIARQGWNGKGMWLAIVGGHEYELNIYGQGQPNLLPWIGMKTADNKFVPWLASQTDILAEDWVKVTE